jgi:alanyl-tRNA synthetase
LSSAEADLVDTATRLQDERKAMGKALRKLENETLLREAESWMNESVELDGVHVLAKTTSELGPAELRALATRLVETSGRIVLLGSVADGRAHLVFARSEDGRADMGALIRGALSAVDGRGGGSPSIAQGGGPEIAGLDNALAAAKQLLVS